MLTRRELKQKSKEHLQGKIGISFLCHTIWSILVLPMIYADMLFVEYLFSTNFRSVSLLWLLFLLLLSLISLILLPPLILGLFKVYWEMSYDNHPNIPILFSGFRQYRQTFLVSFILFAGLLLSLLFLLIPFLGGIIYFYVALGFSMVYYIMAEQPDLSAIDVLKASWSMMKGNRWKYIVLWLSFLPWLLLCYVTLGIAYVYVTPYVLVANANFYHNIKRNQSIFEPDVMEAFSSPIEEAQAITESAQEDIEPRL
ncbi:MAG: DUF975 family protein [Lachnospiraceae bacterium]